MAEENEKLQQMRELLMGLAECLDPLAFNNPDPWDRMVRHRYAMCRLVAVEKDLDRAFWLGQVTPSAVISKEAVMTPDLTTKTAGEAQPDPLLQITLDLAAAINPSCEGLSVAGYSSALLTNEQYRAVLQAMDFVTRVCRVAEQDYGLYLFSNKTVMA